MTKRLPFTLRQLDASMDSLAKAERRAARFLIDQPEAGDFSVSDVATGAGTSEATVVRMCKKAGFNGFQDLKMRLLRDLASPRAGDGGEVDPGDSARVVVQKVFASAGNSLQESGRLLEPALLLAAAESVEQAAEVTLFGVGTSAYVALDAMRRLMRIGIRVSAETSGADQAVRASLLDSSALVIAISTAGTSRDVVEAVRIARQQRARIIAVTHQPGSPLALAADVVLPVAAEESAFGTEAMAARLAALAVLDALFVLLAMRRNEITVANLDRIGAALDVRQLRG